MSILFSVLVALVVGAAPVPPTAQFYGVSTKGEFIYKLSDGTYRAGPAIPFFPVPAIQPPCVGGSCPLQPQFQPPCSSGRCPNVQPQYRW
jgi:hypothetical protein